MPHAAFPCAQLINFFAVIGFITGFNAARGISLCTMMEVKNLSDRLSGFNAARGISLCTIRCLWITYYQRFRVSMPHAAFPCAQSQEVHMRVYVRRFNAARGISLCTIKREPETLSDFKKFQCRTRHFPVHNFFAFMGIAIVNEVSMPHAAFPCAQ